MTCFRMPDGTTLRQYCLANNLEYKRVYELCDRGYTIENAIKHYQERKGRKDSRLVYKYKDASVRCLCGENRLPYHMFLYYLHKGHTVDSAFEIVCKKRQCTDLLKKSY